MRAIRAIAFGIIGAAILTAAAASYGQIVINEIVDDNRLADSTGGDPDTREFIELYNAGNTTVDIGGWSLNYWLLGGATGPGSYFPVSDEIPAGTMLAPGDYWVIGHNEVDNVDQPLGSAIDLFPNQNTVFELRDGPQATGNLVDAVALETFRSQELANLRPEHPAQVGGGYWGQSLTMFANPPNVPQSIGRYFDGRDTNVNGRDFGFAPITPGASNNLPQNASHTIPDVDSLAVGTELGTNYYSSFVLPRVIDPTVLGPAGAGGNNINTKAITASPQGGRAIVAYDETGGGNASYSRELVNKFELYAYIETADLNLGQTAIQSEASTYGIGTTDPFFGTPNPVGLNTLTSTQNGNTGIGWMIQRAEAANGGVTTTRLMLIDFNDGGDSVMADADWQVLQNIDLSSSASDWHFLSIDYNPATGDVIAKHNDDTYNFTTSTDLIGTFYVGYRENLPGTGNTAARPPTYDLFVPPAGLTGDYNDDGKVDGADYVVWRKHEGTMTALPNDPVGGMIGATQFNNWRMHFGEMEMPGSGSGIGAVPEPSAVALVLLGLASLAARGRWGR
jgi:hypothetical protein